jgi:tetratricopeptide (TPR) repeat protein
VEGRALFAKGEYRKALDNYATLFAETNDPLFLRNIGRCYQKLRTPDKAIDAFREYLRRSPRIKPAERAEVEGFIKEMEELQRSEAAARPVAPPPAETAPPPQPPPPDLSARQPAPSAGGAPPAAVIEIPAPATESPPVYKRWWFWTAVGAVAVGAVVTAVALSSSSTSVGNCMGVPDCVRVKN